MSIREEVKGELQVLINNQIKLIQKLQETEIARCQSREIDERSFVRDILDAEITLRNLLNEVDEMDKIKKEKTAIKFPDSYYPFTGSSELTPTTQIGIIPAGRKIVGYKDGQIILDEEKKD